MKNTAVLGIVLIVLGLFALVYQGFSYTKREKVLDLGAIEATATTRKTVPIPPVAGVLAVVAGIALVVTGSRRT
jgi:uncharacterized membrane protein HdeD (DUF308 family)